MCYIFLQIYELFVKLWRSSDYKNTSKSLIPLEKAVRINHAQGLPISVNRVDGVRAGYVEEALESQVFNLTSGIYIVKVGAYAFKVMIR